MPALRLSSTALVAVLAATLGGFDVPAARAATPAPVGIPAQAWVVVDDADGAVLAGRRARTPRAVASITKLMTAYLTLRSAPPGRVLRVPAAATRIGEAGVQLRPGARVRVGALLDALLVPSANDAAETLAVGLAGSERAFVRRMNAAAARLGMRDTVYRAPYGLDAPGQHSTALDSARLARVLMRDARFRRVVRKRAVVVAGRRFVTTNDLLGAYPGLDGVKTGHTDEAGWSLVGSAWRDGRRMYVAALGARDAERRDLAVRRLLDWGFDRYRPVRLVRAGQVFGSVPLPWDGGHVEVAAQESLDRVLRVGTPTGERVVLPGAVTLPLRRGDRLGHVEVSVAGKRVGTVPLVATRDVAAPSLLDRADWIVGRAADTVLDPGSWF